MTIRAIGLVSAMIALLPAGALAQTGNPMWVSGYKWECKASVKTVCERDDKCENRDSQGETFKIDYVESRVVFHNGAVRIKRHYRQTVAESPLQQEVKIELVDNRVIWLTPVDGSRTYSQAWTGAMVEPKSGVVLSITEALYCLPLKDE